jgi:predicted AAA+ superfamily ATPase
MLPRPSLFASLQAALARAPVVALLGPRQCGKTTLARQLVPVTSANTFDLEDPISLARLEEPLTALAELRGTVVIDEVQRRPELFPILRVLADRADAPARFLILGSASPALLRQSSESLAGRLEIVEMAGFSLAEVGEEDATSLWLRGGFPRSFLADSEEASLIWRRDFIRTLLESDIPQLGVRVPAATLQRFWAMLAHFHGQLWNGAELGRSLGVNQTTCRRYLDLLEGVFMVRLLQPWHANLLKRQVKAPKIYFRDTGLLHQLLQIQSHGALLCHPRLGASWEGYVIEQLLAAWRRTRSAGSSERSAHRHRDQAG